MKKKFFIFAMLMIVFSAIMPLFNISNGVNADSEGTYYYNQLNESAKKNI